MTGSGDIAVSLRPRIVLASGRLGLAAVAVLMAGLAGCSGNARGGPHRTSLPRAISGYHRGVRQAGSQGTVFYGDKHFTDVKAAVYDRKGAAPGSPSPGPGTIAADTGRLIKITPGQALADIYRRFRSLGKVGGQSPFGTRRAVPAGPLGGEAVCWRVAEGTGSGSTAGDGAMCEWADSDTFGLLLTPGMTPGRLASTMLTFRSAIETPVPAS
jgi:hypothetical protein